MKYLLGDKEIAAGTVVHLAMHGYVAPAGKIEFGAPQVAYQLTDKGRQLAQELAA